MSYGCRLLGRQVDSDDFTLETRFSGICVLRLSISEDAMKKEMTAAALLGMVVAIVPSVGYTAPAGPSVTVTNSSSIVTQVKSNLSGTKAGGAGKLHECW